MEEKINALSLIRAFGAWSEANSPNRMDKLLWYELWQFFNRLGWPEWLAIDIPRLAAMIGATQATVIKHRDSLIRNGLLGYQKGKKGTPSRYTLNCTSLIKGDSIGNPIGQSKGYSIGNPIGQSISIIRERERQRPNGIPPLPPLGELGGVQLQQTVEEWIAYKAEKRQAYKPAGLKALLSQIRNQVAKHGEPAVVSVVQQSMSANYQGIVWDRLTQKPGKAVPEGQYVQRTYDPAKYSGFTAEDIAAIKEG